MPLWACAAIACAGRTQPTTLDLEVPGNRSVAPVGTVRVDLDSDLYLRKIGAGAFVITHAFPWPANSLLVEMADGTLVLVGTPYTPETTRTLLAWARATFSGQSGSRQIVAINPGYHVDNLGGNRALVEAGIPVYGSELTARLLRERGESARQRVLSMIGDKNDRTYATHATLAYVAPDHLFAAETGLVLRFGGERVEILSLGASQAPDKVAVYFPSRRLLFGSCAVLGGARLGNVAEADFPSWAKAIRTLMALPVDVVVPGHGDRLDPGLLPHTLDLVSAMPSSP